MKKNFLLLWALLITFQLFSQNEMVWPVKNKRFGENIIPLKMNKEKKQIKAYEFFINMSDQDTIVSPVSGKIKYIYCCYIINDHSEYSSSKINVFEDGYKFKAFKSFRELNFKIQNKDCITTSVGIEYPNGYMIYLTGLKLLKRFKTGDRIKAGEVLGLPDRAYHKINGKCLDFSISKHTKITNIFKFYGLKPTDDFYNEYEVEPLLKLKRKDLIKLKLTPKEQKQDFNLFVTALREGHPSLYGYSTKCKFDSLVNKKYSELNKDLTQKEFAVKLLEIDALIKDSHTSFSKLKMNNYHNLYDIEFGIENNQLKITRTTFKYAHLLNKRINSINYQSSKEIKENVKKLFNFSDGYIQSEWSRYALTKFTDYYSLYYTIEPGETLRVKLENDSVYYFKATTLEKTFYPSYRANYKKRNFKIHRVNKHTAILDLNTFYIYETEMDAISRMVNNPSLKTIILDLRDNYGGSEKYLNQIFSLFAKEKFKSFLYNQVNSQHYNFFKYTDNYTTIDSIFYKYKRYENNFRLVNKDFINPAPNTFNGNLYVLTNENSKSASTVFAALVKKYKVGKIIGRETGSTFHHMNALKFTKLLLSNSQLIYRMPLVKSVFEDKKNHTDLWGRGVIPDYEIKLSMNELTNTSDLFLEKAKEIMGVKDEPYEIMKEDEPLEIFEQENSIWELCVLQLYI